jgi:hypothetical protein
MKGGTRWLAVGLLALASQARAWPDPGGALHALAATPFRVTGDAIGAAGLVTASAVGFLGDGVALVDANRFTAPVLFGLVSGSVRRAALGVSHLSTGALEGLRAEDVERLPEPREAYLDNAFGAGRLDTALTGLGALRLGLEDTLSGPARFALRGVGALDAARSVEAFERDERIRVLGPLVREADAAPQ